MNDFSNVLKKTFYLYNALWRQLPLACEYPVV